MRRYLAVTGLVFVAILLAHAARVAVEGTRLLGEADFIVTSLAAAGLAGWALMLWRRSR